MTVKTVTSVGLDPSEQRIVAYLLRCEAEWQRSAEKMVKDNAFHLTTAKTYAKAAMHIKEGRHRETDPALLAEALEHIEALQFAMDGRCIRCSGTDDSGHSPTCPIGQWLQRARGTP